MIFCPKESNSCFVNIGCHSKVLTLRKQKTQFWHLENKIWYLCKENETLVGNTILDCKMHICAQHELIYITFSHTMNYTMKMEKQIKMFFGVLHSAKNPAWNETRARKTRKKFQIFADWPFWDTRRSQLSVTVALSAATAASCPQGLPSIQFYRVYFHSYRVFFVCPVFSESVAKCLMFAEYYL
jgi:hypothetical protein